MTLREHLNVDTIGAGGLLVAVGLSPIFLSMVLPEKKEHVDLSSRECVAAVSHMHQPVTEASATAECLKAKHRHALDDVGVLPAVMIQPSM